MDRLHPDDVNELAAAMLKGIAPDPNVLRQMLQEEFARERRRMLDDLKRMIRDEARRVFDEDIPEKFALISLRIDGADNIERTRRMIDDLKRAQETTGEFRHEAFRQIIKAFGIWVAGGIAIVLGVLGYKGGGH